MLPEIGASELLVIAIVALIVVGPKDLPALLRKLGQFMARLRGMAAEFRTSFDEMARQSELDELRKEVAAMRSGNLGVDAALAAPLAAYADIDREVADAVAGINDLPPYSYDPPASVAEPQAPPPKPARKPRAAKPKAAAGKPAARPRRSKIVEGGS